MTKHKIRKEVIKIANDGRMNAHDVIRALEQRQPEFHAIIKKDRDTINIIIKYRINK